MNKSLPQPCLRPQSCQRCRMKKIKCDKARPCSNCHRVQNKCVSPQPSRVKRSTRLRIKHLAARLERLESCIPQIINNDQDPNYLLQRAAECRQIGASTDDVKDSLLPAQLMSIMTFPSLSANLSTMRPSAAQMMALWRIFKINIDPVARTLHRPTTETLVASVALGHRSMSETAEALLFSIWLGVVESISEDECLNLFGIQQADLLKKFQHATEMALARTNVMGSPCIVTLQALALYTVFIRSWSSPHDIWKLATAAVRLARSLQLDRMPTKPGINIFDEEMKRRLWWHIFMLENRASEEIGVRSVLGNESWDTPFPANVNDGDFYPGMSKPLQAHTGATEMTFTLTRFETNIFNLKLNKILAAEQAGDLHSSALKNEFLSRCRHALQEKYLRYCDQMSPLLRTTTTVARLSLAKLWLVAHESKRTDERFETTLPTPTKDRLFTKSLQTLEAYLILSKDTETARWYWLLHTFLHFQILALVLSELCVRELRSEERRAWWLLNEIWNEDGASKTPAMVAWQASSQHLFAEARSRMARHLQLG